MGLVPPRIRPPQGWRIAQLTKYEHPMAEEWAQLEEQGKMYNPLLRRPENPALDIVIGKRGRSVPLVDDWKQLIVKEP